VLWGFGQARGSSRRNPWREASIARLAVGEDVFWIDLVYWSTGAQFVARWSRDLNPLAVEPVALCWPWLPHLPRLSEHAMRFLKRVQEDTSAQAAEQSASWKSFQSKYPALAEYMSAETWDDGKPRQTSTLTFFYEDGCVKGCLNDREADRALWVTAGALLEALEAIEKALAAGTGDWRARNSWNRRNSPKKGKN